MADKIIIQDNKIIFDGHAETLRDCQLITAVCDALEQSNNFKTVKYESGYAEFEKISGGERAMFVIHGTINIFSNDGGTTITYFPTTNARVCTLNITDSGLSFKSLYNGVEDGASKVWSYDGSKKFLGLSKAKNSSVVDEGCGIGNTISFDNMEDGAFYIVEGEANTPTLTYDLSQLDLPEGTHSITVVAKADGYSNSAPSNAVEYVVESDSIVGTWVLKSVMQPPATPILFDDIDAISYFYLNDTATISTDSITAISPSNNNVYVVSNTYVYDDFIEAEDYTYNKFYYTDGVISSRCAEVGDFVQTSADSNNGILLRTIIVNGFINSNYVSALSDWLNANATKIA